MTLEHLGRYARQSFIGDQGIIERAIAGTVGLGGGGSIVVTQLAHAGFKNYALYDPNQFLEERHLNRTLGANRDSVQNKVSKIENARRIVTGLHEDANLQLFQSRWQENPNMLSTCDIVFGCVDGLGERQQLEAFCRRHLIPYIDIGLVVKGLKNPVLAGQVIVSMPGFPCMKCLGFLDDRDLAAEAQAYGDAGNNPQVIWGNLVLGGTAVNLAVKILTGWAGEPKLPIYLQYNGNDDSLVPHERMRHLNLSKPCPHFHPDDVGSTDSPTSSASSYESLIVKAQKSWPGKLNIARLIAE